MRDLFKDNQCKGESGGPSITVERIDETGTFKNDYLPSAQLEVNSPKSTFSYYPTPTGNRYTIRFFTRGYYGSEMGFLNKMFYNAYSSFVVKDGVSYRTKKYGLNNFEISFPAKYGERPGLDTGCIGAGGGSFIPILLFRMNKGEEIAQASFSIHYTLEEISEVTKITVSPKDEKIKQTGNADSIVQSFLSFEDAMKGKTLIEKKEAKYYFLKSLRERKIDESLIKAVDDLFKY